MRGKLMSLPVGGRHAGEIQVIFLLMKCDLADKHCNPCEGGVDPLSSSDAQALLDTLHADWRLVEEGRTISREFTFPAYSRSLGFANAVAWIAITEGHHPDMLVSYSRCVVNYTTHAIGGLSGNDFICAAKVDRLLADDR